jgi:threonine dehydrogenase-like Zn-dependent dehydrogenase
MKALVFDRKPARIAAAMASSRLAPGSGAKWGPLRLKDREAPSLPGPDWVRLAPRLSGICGSDLATIDGQASRYFEPIVSFPFVPGHEIVADVIPGGGVPGGRAVVVPVLHCAIRGIDPVCASCAAGYVNRCERVAFGHLEPGLQTGFCKDTGGGWSTVMVAHRDQLVAIPDDMSDEDAVMIEPTACAVHAANTVGDPDGDVVVLGSGPLGLLTIAALRHLPGGENRTIVATAKYSEQRRWARELGADTVIEPGELARTIRLRSAAYVVGSHLSCGASCVVDCVGSSASITQALEVAAPGATVHVVGMPARVSLDLTALWHRENAIRGCYAYQRSDFDTARDLSARLSLGRLVSATYPLDRSEDAITHAANAGMRGGARIAFDLRGERERRDLLRGDER